MYAIEEFQANTFFIIKLIVSKITPETASLDNTLLTQIVEPFFSKYLI